MIIQAMLMSYQAIMHLFNKYFVIANSMPDTMLSPGNTWVYEIWFLFWGNFNIEEEIDC